MPTPTSDYEVVIQTDQKIRMRDGVNLFADIYRPAKLGTPLEGKFSTVLVRTFRGKENVFDIDARYFAARGFVLVLQDVRGRYKSEGAYYHGVAEADDGYDTIEWIAGQPWSNGKVGMTGISYLAAVQCAAAISGAPHLSSLFHVQGPFDYYRDHYRRGGETNLYVVPIVLMFAATAKEALGNAAMTASLETAFINARDWMKRWPLKKGLNPLSQVPSLEDWLLDPLKHPDYDDFWKRVALWQPGEYLDKYADIPSFYFSGWYDIYREDLFYSNLRPRKKGPIKLQMGPWLHNDFGRAMGDVDFGPDAAMTPEGFNQLQLRWFQQTLGDDTDGGGKTGILGEPPVKIFVMGGGGGTRTASGKLDHGGKWRFENEWPIARTKYTPYYLHSDGSLASEKDTSGGSSTSYDYDPSNPVPTIGTTFFFLELLPKAGSDGGKDVMSRRRKFVPQGPYDQKENPEFFGCTTSLPLASRHDVIVFQTPPLSQDVEVTGPITVKLWASSSVVDTDFAAKLIDVHPPNGDYPDGYAMNLTNSLIRGCYRNGFERSELMNPGEKYEFTIDLPATSNLVAKGHRIRLDISSSNYPEFDVNPNTGETHVGGGKTVVARNTIYHNATQASHIVLPIIPAS